MKSIILILGLMACGIAYGQDNNEKLQIYLDCQYCDQTYFRQNLSNADFVRDRKVADVHLMFIRQRNGAGGWSEIIQFIGIEDYDDMEDTVTYTTDINMTADEKRQLQLKYIELGLIRYWLKHGDGSSLDVTINTEVAPSDTVEKDPWNYWVFGLNLNGWANGQETYHSINVNGGINAKRITEKNKFSFRANYNRNFRKYIYDNTVTTGNQQRSWFEIQDVLTINDHWSYGFFNKGGNSIFGNYRFYNATSAGIEYNFFPYQKSSTKQATIGYEIGGRYNNYYDTTVFNKTEEIRPFHRLTVAGSVKQPWGSLTATAAYFNFLHDFRLNSAAFWVNFNVRLFKGFSWRINGGFDILHDQINLKKEGASLEEVLLQQQQLGTGYSYWISTGINYSFGSIYNSIVNPRFDF